MAEKGTPVTISGARTGIAGGAVPRGGMVIATERLAGIEEIFLDEASGEWRVRLGPAVTLKTLQALACAKKRLEKRRHAESKTSDAIRAAISSPSMPRRPRPRWGVWRQRMLRALSSHGYGATRAYVRALRVALAGRRDHQPAARRAHGQGGGKPSVLHTEAGREIAVPTPAYRTPAIKNTAGLHASSPFDAIDLFIGTEGTLGVITQLELALVQAPELFFGGLAFFPSEEAAVGFVTMVRDERPAGTEACRPAALEYFDAEALRLGGSGGEPGATGLAVAPARRRRGLFRTGLPRGRDWSSSWTLGPRPWR